jgi:hypothetical protein
MHSISVFLLKIKNKTKQNKTKQNKNLLLVYIMPWNTVWEPNVCQILSSHPTPPCLFKAAVEAAGS